jgi:hypothetical protein
MTLLKQGGMDFREVLRRNLLGTIDGRVAIFVGSGALALAISLLVLDKVSGIDLPTSASAALLVLPVFLFLMFVVWPPDPPTFIASALRWSIALLVVIAPWLMPPT